MNEDNTKKLKESFPFLYSNSNPREPFNYGGAGFQCGDGWYNIIYTLSEKLENILLKMNLRERSEHTVAQVKEKFGTLRFYMTSATEEMHNAIRETEKQSTTTCEECGEVGRLRGGRWLSTECDKCLVEGVVNKLTKELMANVEQYDDVNWENKPVKRYRLSKDAEYKKWANELLNSKLVPVESKSSEE